MQPTLWEEEEDDADRPLDSTLARCPRCECDHLITGAMPRLAYKLRKFCAACRDYAAESGEDGVGRLSAEQSYIAPRREREGVGVVIYRKGEIPDELLSLYRRTP